MIDVTMIIDGGSQRKIEKKRQGTKGKGKGTRVAKAKGTRAKRKPAKCRHLTTRIVKNDGAVVYGCSMAIEYATNLDYFLTFFSAMCDEPAGWSRCGAVLSLGPSNDFPSNVKTEMRAAGLIQYRAARTKGKFMNAIEMRGVHGLEINDTDLDNTAWIAGWMLMEWLAAGDPSVETLDAWPWDPSRPVAGQYDEYRNKIMQPFRDALANPMYRGMWPVMDVASNYTNNPRETPPDPATGECVRCDGPAGECVTPRGLGDDGDLTTYWPDVTTELDEGTRPGGPPDPAAVTECLDGMRAPLFGATNTDGDAWKPHAPVMSHIPPHDGFPGREEQARERERLSPTPNADGDLDRRVGGHAFTDTFTKLDQAEDRMRGFVGHLVEAVSFNQIVGEAWNIVAQEFQCTKYRCATEGHGPGWKLVQGGWLCPEHTPDGES